MNQPNTVTVPADVFGRLVLASARPYDRWPDIHARQIIILCSYACIGANDGAHGILMHAADYLREVEQHELAMA